MHKLALFLKNIIIFSLVILFSIANADDELCNEDDEYYAGLNIPISFMPGKSKCIKYKPSLPGDNKLYHYYRNLKEFKINKNGKYCLWGSKNWDEECQNVSLEYVYSNYGYAPENWKDFKQVVVSFIKHIQNNEFEEALKLTGSDTLFFTDDDANCLEKKSNIWNKNIPGCRSYFNKFHKDKKRYDDFNMASFRENLIQIDVENLKFYLADHTKRMMYSVIIPYEHKNIKKEFSIVFCFCNNHPNNVTATS